MSPLYTPNGIIFHIKTAKTTPIKLADYLEGEMDFVVGEMMDFVRNSGKKKTRDVKIGQDLYVKRRDGFEKIYKNNSDFYMHKVQERQVHMKRCEKLKQQSDNCYTPVSRKSKVKEFIKSTAKSQNSDERKVVANKQVKSENNTPKETINSPVQNLSKKFSAMILQEITNMPLTTQKVARRIIN